MTPFKFTLPPKKPGVYVFRHAPTQQVYIGSTSSLHRRFQEWRSVINSGSYWKSSVIAEALKDTTPDDWEFVVLATYAGVDEAVAMEAALVREFSRKDPERCLNTVTRNEPTEKQASPLPATTLTYEGVQIDYAHAADVLKCDRKTLTKRLAKWRAKGVTEFTVEKLMEIGTGRPQNFPA